ncbi:MAG: glycosyltransferase family 2 protein [Prevotellaceae bacterium]|jgi:glycosyltransferase involved in cell wall biosynthesis|nr:glycosyltransferase family 2 protein [Prevotellaceae bacterium]
MRQKLISVALATCNGEKFIREQLNSILWQTYPNFEIVIADDCSTDSTPEILKEYAEKYPNVSIYPNVQKVGMVKNFEKALRHCKGDFIAFADQDDIWLPDKLQYLFSNIDDNTTMIYHDSAYIDVNGNFMNKRASDYRKFISGRNLFMMNETSGLCIYGHASMFCKTLLEKALPLCEHISHDGWIIYIAMLEGNLKALPDAKVLYRQHGHNVSGGFHAGVKKTKKKHQKTNYVAQIEALLSILPETETEYRRFFESMKMYYANPTFTNRLKRLCLRLKYLNEVYAMLKRNSLRKAIRAIKRF